MPVHKLKHQKEMNASLRKRNYSTKNLAGIEYSTAYYLDVAPQHSIVASAWYGPLNKETIFFDTSLISSTEFLCPKVDSTRYVASAPSLLATLN